MRVTSILGTKGSNIVTVEPQQSLADAARLLAERRIGAVLITGADGSLAGILSERDIVAAVAKAGADCLDDTVAHHMTRAVVTCRPEDSLTEIMQMMTDGRFRHLPVVDGGRLIGIISIGDVVKQRIDEIEQEARDMRSYITSA